MKKRLAIILLTICIMLTMLPTISFAETAEPSKTSFVMNGKPVSVTAAYMIKGNNYLQLRAIAVMLNGTSAQFEISMDGQYAVIEPGKPYSGTVTKTTLQNTTDVKPSNTKFKINGDVISFSDAKLINGSTNYIQLREFAQKLSGTKSQFNVYWDSTAGQAVLQPGVAYTGVAPLSGGTKPTAKGGTTRTINMDNLLTLEISNTYSYARVLGYDPSGATTVHFVVVPEGATIKCTKYVPPYNNEYWQKNEYSIAEYSSIYFKSGALWPTVTYDLEYDDWERAGIAQGDSITLTNGTEYNFDTSTSDKAITAKYGNVGAAFYILRVFVVPNELAGKIGGTAPKITDSKTTIQEYRVPTGASSDPVTYIPDPNAMLLSHDGWYDLMYDHINDIMRVEIDSKGNAELRNGTPFYVEKVGNTQVTLRMGDGKYLGIEGTAANGVWVKAVKDRYLWNIYYENNDGFFDNNRYSLRPSTNTGLVLTASGTIKEGTPIVLSTQKNMDAPKNSEFTFFPSDAPKSVAFSYTSDDLTSDGVYYIKASKSPNFVFDVMSRSKDDGAKLVIYNNEGGKHQRFKITRVKDNQYTIQSVNSGKWITSSGEKGKLLTQSGSATDSTKTFIIVKQDDGTYRIMDSKGLYVGISEGKMKDMTNVILWPKASDTSQTFLFEKVN
ncbi:MAG: RICIN domain-containing protein [Clostridiaceae bacterium]|nr:RICIN domain-containing protein [Clostridiaceae bacterium]